MSRAEFAYGGLDSETPCLYGPGVCVSFQRANGLLHSLRFTTEPGLAEYEYAGLRFGISSVSARPEYDIEPDDPARVLNPVFQELVKHELPAERGPGLCVLLTGSCFEHHFSAVFSLCRDQAAPASVAFEVDLADRCRAPIRKLAATYSVVHDAPKPEFLGPGRTAATWHGGSLGAATLELVIEPRAKLAPLSTASEVQIDASIDPEAFTQRLRYRWRWTSCADRTR
jgi:hypothetical protein